jgi:hypothetical protein
VGYCEPSDLFDFGLPRGALSNPGRIAASVNASSNAFTLDVHGFALNDLVSFRPGPGGSLPAPLAEGTTYYVIPLSESTFSVAAAAGGGAVDLTTAGARVYVIAPLPVEAGLAAATSMVEDMLPAHLLPLTAPYPVIVVMTTAELAAAKLAAMQGNETASLSTTLDLAQKRLARWAQGIPIRGPNAPAPANLAAAAAAAPLDFRGWSRWGGL